MRSHPFSFLNQRNSSPPFITIELCSSSLHEGPQVAMIAGELRHNTVVFIVFNCGMNHAGQNCPKK